MLDGLKQVEITIAYGPEGNQRDIAFFGPRLMDLMIMAGAEGKTAKPMAMDGYQSEVPWDSIQRINRFWRRMRMVVRWG